MKFLHLSDLHIGKRVHGYSMLEDQSYILQQILVCISAEQPDAVLICGDVYDKAVPSAEAVALCDDFFYQLSLTGVPVFVISGNHDSPERLAFGSRLMDGSGVHFAPVYNGAVRPFTLVDAYGRVDVYLLPFVKPAHVRRYFPEAEIESYTDALAAAVEAMQVDTNQRNVLLTHQFVTGAITSDVEELSVGGTDQVNGSVFDSFDYVALGHIHRPQNMGSPRLRYCGAPLQYSFSEVNHSKSMTIAELGEKGDLQVRTLPFRPRRKLTELRGTYLELTARAYYEQGDFKEDYLHITLTDQQDVPDAMGRLRSIYPYLMLLDYDNDRTRALGQVSAGAASRPQSPFDLFADFYRRQNGGELTEEQAAFLQRQIESVWEDEVCDR